MPPEPILYRRPSNRGFAAEGELYRIFNEQAAPNRGILGLEGLGLDLFDPIDDLAPILFGELLCGGGPCKKIASAEMIAIERIVMFSSIL